MVKRVIGLLALIMGLVGMIAALAGTVTVWRVGARLTDVTETAFEQMGVALNNVQGKVARTTRIIQNAKLTAETLREKIQQRVADQARERVRAGLELDELEKRLTSALGETEQWVQIAAEAGGLAQQFLAIVSSVVVVMDQDPSALEQPARQLQTATDRVAEISASLAKIKENLANVRDKENVEENRTSVAKLAFRIVANLEIVNRSVDQFGNRLDKAQQRLASRKEEAIGRIFAGEILVTFLLFWIAIGQLSLLVHGWSLFRFSER